VGRQSYPRHGYFESPEYRIWSNFKVEAKKHGFHVDPQWAADFKAFLDDMGERPTAWHRLRRRDTKGSFDAVNCFWKKPLSTQEKEAIRRRYFTKWKAKNGELKRLRDRLFYLANKDRFLVYGRARRALKNNAPGHHSKADIDRIFKAQRGRCGYCRVKLSSSYHVDHIQSLSRGGHNGRRNLQILCQSCNLSKGAKDPIDYARQIGKLV
jgi:5-methylcytosine-specific restriction endonuclease McrA